MSCCETTSCHHHESGCTCGCCGCGSFSRRFITRKERLAYLEDYKDELKRELEGVEEKISELKGK